MSVKIIDSAEARRRNENAQKRILFRQSNAQKRFVFPKSETPSLSDKSEFPSLSESLEKPSSYSHSSGEPLKYSDKLKASTSTNQVSTCSNIQFKCDNGIFNTNQCDYKISKSKFQDNKTKPCDNSKTNVPNHVPNHSLNKPVNFNNKFVNVVNKEQTKQKPVLKPKFSVQNAENKSSPSHSSNNVNKTAKSNIQSNKSVTVESNEFSKEEKCATATKKKKRKSKIKRQAALQSGKITFLTPEVHSRILNQASPLNAQSPLKNRVIGNINDEEEYPELGKAALSDSQKENFLKKNVSSECQAECHSKSTDSTIDTSVISENVVEEPPVVIPSEKSTVEKKVHSHNPITVSFYDMLIEKNVKQKKEVKELKMKVETPDVIGFSKLKNKMNMKHPHNLLDSSSPAIKRGKEREKPKPKKPSQLKKIILLDRKARQEYLLQMKNNNEKEKIANESGLQPELNEEEDNNIFSENKDQYDLDFMNELPVLYEGEDDDEKALRLNETNLSCIPNELDSEMALLSISDADDSYDILSDFSPTFEKDTENNSFPEKIMSDVLLNENVDSGTEKNNILGLQTSNQSDAVADRHPNVLKSPESLLSNLITTANFDYSDKERAVKILLHTRNFREYCNHLISKDIDDAAYALLDDLARFQDRLHNKDPVKARMKKRMVYGVKEVKKHLKLRKLKCIIIAVDIENVETQGGLNDILNEIKTSAVDHRVPYIFALGRKVLGKVCRKPVPVSCVGVFNYEGSEANFKKVVELQAQGKADYSEIFNKLLVKITDKEVATLIKAKKEAPETLRDVRANILSNFFVLSESMKNDNENTDLKSNEAVSDLFDNSA